MHHRLCVCVCVCGGGGGGGGGGCRGMGDGYEEQHRAILNISDSEITHVLCTCTVPKSVCDLRSVL